MPEVLEALAWALAHQQAGRFREAEAVYRQVLELEPNCAEAHGDLAIALYQLGRLAEAETACRRAIRQKPELAEAHANLAAILLGQGRFAEAEAAARAALLPRPDHAEAHNNLGGALERQGRFQEAEVSYRRATELKPDFAIAWHNRGNMLERRRHVEEAETCYRRVLDLRPDFAEAYNNLGTVLHQQGRWAEALASYQAALRLKPDMAEAHNGMGVALQWANRDAEALTCYERALELKADSAEAHYNRATLWLRHGDYARGWEEYEWRRKLSDAWSRRFRQPLWDGSALEGRTILVHSELGLGDTVQFIRYLPLVKQRGGRVVLESQARLAPLVESVRGVDQVVVAGQTEPGFDVHVPLHSLPRLFGTTLESIPSQVPYLEADERRVALWGQRISGEPGTKVGLAWRGNPASKTARKRFMPLKSFAPLVKFEGIRLFSLQRGSQGGGLDAAPPELRVTQLEDDSTDTADTAAIIANLDLVVSVDTMVAHLAGALGKPVWVLLAFSPEWRWMLGREDSPWYPTARLFRQQQEGDWRGVVERVVEALRHGYHS